jgi:glycerate 2-kinase
MPVYQSCRPHAKRWLNRVGTWALTRTFLSQTAWMSSALPLCSTPRGIFSGAPQYQTPLEQTMTRHALEIVQKGIQAVDPNAAIQAHFEVEGNILKIGTVDTLNLQDYDELVLVAFGKASSAMASAVLKQLDSRIPSSGVVICKDDHGTPEEMQILGNAGIHVQMASHPVPDKRSLQGAASLMNLVRSRQSKRTLVICCISGGGSALFCQPTAPLTLDDLQAVNSVLLASGMSIHEMNVIRKRLEEGKGGKLAAECYPSQLVTLVLSDVLGDPLDLIASGPTVPDSSTWKDAWSILQQYNLEDRLPDSVVQLLQAGLDGVVGDSPSRDHAAFETAKTILVGNNAHAVDAAARHAKALGYHTVVLGTQIQGEAREIPQVYAAMAKQLQQEEITEFSPARSLPAAFIAGGETTVSMPSHCHGKGGRNQELALAAGILLEKLNLRNVVLASVGTDGTDGPTDAAGAVVDATTVMQNLEGARAALAAHDAYSFFDELGKDARWEISPLIKTGPTGTNVADICVTLVGKPPSDHYR